jgi:hypothetical protein
MPLDISQKILSEKYIKLLFTTTEKLFLLAQKKLFLFFLQSSSILSPVSDEATDCISISSSSSKSFSVLVNSLVDVGLSINSVIRIDGPPDERDEFELLDAICDILQKRSMI